MSVSSVFGIKDRKPLIGLFFIFFSILVAHFFLIDSDKTLDLRGEETITIALTDEGFVPNDIYISPSTTVVFKNETDTNFWPASDLHPHHHIDPDFDPKRPIASGKTWSFNFTKAGVWEYHDHIGLQIGVITVVPNEESDPDRYHSLLTCDQEDDIIRAACEKRQVVLILQSEGVDAAFSEMMRIYDSNPYFRRQCHNFGHDFGLQTYQIYGENFDTTTKTLFCGQGFYHGYMEGFMQGENGDFARGMEFCDKQAELLGEEYFLVGPQCIHGMGHGIMEFLLRNHPELNNQIYVLIERGLDKCDELRTNDEKFRCASGVYAVAKDWINIQGLSDLYPEWFNTEDPVYICRSLSLYWQQEACAWEMAKQIVILGESDPEEIFTMILEGTSDWEDGHFLPQMIRSSAGLLGEVFVNNTDEELAGFCSVITDKELYDVCIEGIVLGLIFVAKPESEATDTGAFCNWPGHDDDSKYACAAKLVQGLGEMFGEKGRDDACAAIASIKNMESICPELSSD